MLMIQLRPDGRTAKGRTRLRCLEVVKPLSALGFNPLFTLGHQLKDRLTLWTFNAWFQPSGPKHQGAGILSETRCGTSSKDHGFHAMVREKAGE